MVLFMTIYTDQKLSRNSRKTHLMVVSEQSERAEIFAPLRQKHYVFLYRPENQKLQNLWYFWV